MKYTDTEKRQLRSALNILASNASENDNSLSNSDLSNIGFSPYGIISIDGAKRKSADILYDLLTKE